MHEIRWTWSDANLLKRGLASAGLAWHCSRSAEEVLRKLENLKPKDRRRPLRFDIHEKKFSFANPAEAIEFLQTMVDEETLKARQVQLQRSPPLPVESTTATLTAAPEAPAAVTARAARRGARARCCARGHMIARKGEAFGLFQDKKICHACCTTFGPETSYYRCMQNCKYNVCHHCFQEARHSEAQQMLEGQSEPSCQESHSDVESVLEFEVHGGLRSELWPFAESRSRPFAAQLEELAEVFEVPHGVLLHSQGSEVEVIQSILQLQALPRTASLALEAPQQLLQQLLGQMSSSPDALRHLVSILCATEALAAEAFRQGALPALVAQLCCSTERATSTASATGLCALLRPTRKEEAKEQLEQLWSEHGDALLRRLTRPGVGKAETALLLWLVEELELASETFRALQEGDSGSPSAAEEGEREGPSSGLQEQEMGRDVLELLRESCAVPCSEAQQLQRGKQLKEAKLFAERLQRTVRRQHRALKAMVPLVKLQDVELEKTLQKIVEDGWDSTDWPDGQNLLHFLCQHGDAQTVRLAAELCPDLEARDGQDLRAMDYALSNSDASVAEELLLVSQERRSFRFLEETTVDELAKVPRSMSLVSQEVLAPGPRESGHAVPTVPDQSEAQHWAQCTAPGSNEVQCTGLEVQGDGHGIGALYMLRTQLAKERKEKEMWREKAQEVEQLRTRLAIWTEKPDAPPDRLAAVTLSAAEGSAATPRERGAVSGDFRRSEAPEERGESQRAETKLQLKDPGTRSSRISSSSSTAEEAELDTASVSSDSDSSPRATAAESEAEREPPTDADVPASKAIARDGGESPTPKPVVPPKGKGKGKGKAIPAAPSVVPGEGDGKGKAKGKGKVAQAEPTKPEVKPHQELKTVPWTRYLVGAQIEEGNTIWHQVNQVYQEDHIMEALPMDEIEKRFGKAGSQQKVQKAPKQEVKKRTTVKLSSIAQEQRFQIEVCLRTLPVSLNTGTKAAKAIQDLDRSAFSVETLSSIRRFLCPNAEQEAELRAKRATAENESEPLLWDPVEHYMEELLQIKACSIRLSSWEFLYNLPERLGQIEENLLRFERMVLSFLKSSEIPFLLSLVLAFGNYLNGGKNEKRLGRADGFHVELLGRPGGLDLVNDTQGRNVRQLIFEVFSEKYPSHLERLFMELQPVFALVQRRLGKDAQGVPALRKTVRVEIEDLEKQLVQLKAEFTSKHEEMKAGLKMIDDPADPFAVEIPPEFQRAQQRIDELLRKKETTRQQFQTVLSNFKAETYRGDPMLVDGQVKEGNPKAEMTSEVWCKIWDDFFVPCERVLSFDEKKQKTLIEPRFCKDEPLSVESLQILWGLIKEELSAKSAKTRLERRRRASM